LTKTASTGAKIDIVLAMIRMQMFFDDKHGVAKNIERAQRYVFCSMVDYFTILIPDV
jgi:26S proteasome regulatory subunit N7